MPALTHQDVSLLYGSFKSPIAELDCGARCSPYNERGVPFCCDTRHIVPSAYEAEWRYLQENTDLWHLWHGDTSVVTNQLREAAQDGQVLIECLGHHHCQRGYRSISCRAFPFFPYFDTKQRFLGLSVYWEYEDRCWVISNLDRVSNGYRQEFIAAFDAIFQRSKEEAEHFSNYSLSMRRAFKKLRRTISLLHRNGKAYNISPGSERMRLIELDRMPKHGNYKIAAAFPFSDELLG